MKNSNQTLVAYTLATSQKPLTLKELAARTGKSYNTVRNIVTGHPLAVPEGAHPVRYTLTTPEFLDDEILVLDMGAPDEGWVMWLDRIAPKVPSLIQIDKTRDSASLLKQGGVLEALGTNFVKIGRELQEHYNKPDWFTLLGGDESA